MTNHQLRKTLAIQMWEPFAKVHTTFDRLVNRKLLSPSMHRGQYEVNTKALLLAEISKLIAGEHHMINGAQLCYLETAQDTTI